MPVTAVPEQIEIQIHDLSRGGSGVGKDASGCIIFVPFTAAGDRVRVEIIKRYKNYADAQLLEVLTPSPLRVKPPCPVFGRCGGCEWQHLPYEHQWKTKVDGVLHALKRVQVDAPTEVTPFPAEKQWHYRNRIQLRGNGQEAGFFARHSKSLVAIETCEIAREEINARLPAIRAKGAASGSEYKVEVEVLPNGQTRESWNSKHAALGFRQVHDEQNSKLQDYVSRKLRYSGFLFDLYGGSGNLSLGLAARFRSVYCVDLSAGPEKGVHVPENFQFGRSAVLPWLGRVVKSGAIQKGPNSAIVDPPREGLGGDLPAIESALTALKVSELIAVGCDTDRWATDLKKWTNLGWTLQSVAVLDLFPQTHHVESIAVLQKSL
jgi:tRNA/tmRNA/rRNA uracil-C5-methylase (TrmA/RlmC/RlmD family)